MTARLVVADSHWLIRCGLRTTLQSLAEHQVVGEAADVASSVARSVELAADLTLLDVRLPVGGGILAARLIKAHRQQHKVLLLSNQDDAVSLRDALGAGCDGCVRKDSSDRELLEAVRCVLSGGVYLDAEMARQMVLPDQQSEAPQPPGLLALLTGRELTVFRLIAEGRTNRSVGESLHLSPKTVEKYRASLMLKLKLQSAVELRLLALDLGLVQRAALRVA